MWISSAEETLTVFEARLISTSPDFFLICVDKQLRYIIFCVNFCMYYITLQL